MLPNKRTLTISSNQRVVFISMTIICFILFVFYSELFSPSKDVQVKEVPNEETQVQHIQDAQTNVQHVQNGQNVQNVQNIQNTLERPPIASLRKEDTVCIKGNPPVTKEWIKGQLKEFLAVLKQKPWEDDKFTTGVMHQFALWCMIRYIQPEYIVESGLFRGLGTWLLRQAAPNAKFRLLDPRNMFNDEEWTVYYVDRKPDTLYFVDRDNGNFTDFAQMDWKKYIDPAKTFVYIDDHQNPMRRIKEAYNLGFKHLMFDDNYWYGGDMITMKFSCALLMNELSASEVRYRDDFGRVERDLTEHDIKEMYDVFNDLVDIYYEFPMIYNSPRSNTPKDTKNVLFPGRDINDIFTEYGYSDPVDLAWGGRYTGIAYVRVK